MSEVAGDTTPVARLEPMDGIDLPVIDRTLTAQGVEHGPLFAEVLTAGRSNLTYHVRDDAGRGWIVRRPPMAGLTQSAHDVAREYRVADALQGTTVPVAHTVASVEDHEAMGAPFTIVDFVPGITLRTQDDLRPLPDTDIQRCHEELMRVLIALHEVAPAEVGLGDFGRPAGFAARQVALWRRQWSSVATRELPDIHHLHGLLEARVPGSADETIVHGDYRVDNVLLDPADVGKALAVVDWEMATLGDPLTDLGTLCAYQHPDFDHVCGEPAASTSPRWPSWEQIAADYQSASGRPLGDFDFYRALGLFKLAVIAEGIYARYRAGTGDGPGFATAGESVPGLVHAGIQILT